MSMTMNGSTGLNWILSAAPSSRRMTPVGPYSPTPVIWCRAQSKV